MTVEASIYTISVGRRAEAYVQGAQPPLGALVLSIPYPVATALLTGEFTVADLEPPRVSEPGRRDLAARVSLRHEPAMTRELFAGDAPFGEAVRQAGPSGAAWVRTFLGPDLADLADQIVRDAAEAGPRADFADSVKATPARVTVRLADGRTFSRVRSVPLGGAGAHTRAHHARLMREKFIGLGGDPRAAREAGDLDRMSAERLRGWIEAALPAG